MFQIGHIKTGGLLIQVVTWAGITVNSKSYMCITGLLRGMENLENYGIQLSVFKVMNSMKFRVSVWICLDFCEFCRALLKFCLPVYFSCNLMKSFS